MLQDGTQVGHHGARQLAAAEIQGAECRALPERADQVLKGFLEAGLLHPGGPVDLRDCRGFPPLPLPLPAQASPECLHPAPGPGQACAQHTQAAVAESAVQQAQLRQGRGHPQGLREVTAGCVRQFAVAQPVGKKHVACVQAPRPPRCTPTSQTTRSSGAVIQSEECWLHSLPCSPSPQVSPWALTPRARAGPRSRTLFCQSFLRSPCGRRSHVSLCGPSG